jgi:hypothetical protein
MQLSMPIKVDVRGRGPGCTFTRETVECRLAAIAGRTDPDAEREREYLRGVLERKR